MPPALLLPFVLGASQLDESRLAGPNGSYAFRGHRLARIPVPLPPGYAAELDGVRIAQLDALVEPGEPVTLNPARLNELFQAALQ